MLKDVVFLTSQQSSYGSTYLRSDQLMGIVSARLRDLGIGCRLSSDPGSCSNSLVIVGKCYLDDCDPLDFLRLRERGNIVALDFVDRRAKRRLCHIADMLISSSYCQDDQLRREYPGKPVAFIPHHADTRIVARVDEGDDLKVGYFGKFTNGLHLDALGKSDLCAFIRADRVDDPTWIDRLGAFRVHYAVRARGKADGFKPFTKGAIAAKVGALLLTHRDEESVRCLGEDYPFFVDDETLDGVKRSLGELAGMVDTPAWKTAKRALQRYGNVVSERSIADKFELFFQKANSISIERDASRCTASIRHLVVLEWISRRMRSSRRHHGRRLERLGARFVPVRASLKSSVSTSRSRVL